jgi:DNA-binding response OmpR family regulator
MKTILVVDDEFALVEMLESVLVDGGYRVRTATNGRQGLERLREVKPDLVLVDYMMPNLDGPGMIDAMRKQAEHHDTPVIIMSAVGESIVRERVPVYAAFLQKPFRISNALATIKAVFGQNSG